MNLKEIRKEKGLSQGEVAAMLGCSANVYSRYERGERQPSIDVLIDLSRIFEVSVDYLVGNNSANGPNRQAGSPPEPFTASEYRLVNIYRRLPLAAQSSLLVFLEDTFTNLP